MKINSPLSNPSYRQHPPAPSLAISRSFLGRGGSTVNSVAVGRDARARVHTGSVPSTGPFPTHWRFGPGPELNLRKGLLSKVPMGLIPKPPPKVNDRGSGAATTLGAGRPQVFGTPAPATVEFTPEGRLKPPMEPPTSLHPSLKPSAFKM